MNSAQKYLPLFILPVHRVQYVKQNAPCLQYKTARTAACFLCEKSVQTVWKTQKLCYNETEKYNLCVSGG